MSKVYAATRISKEVTVDDFETGCELKCRTIIDDDINLTAPSFALLVGRVFREYCIDLKTRICKFPECGENDDEINGFKFDRLENADGDEHSADEEQRWKAGKIKLWQADYYVRVEVREVRDLSPEDFNGIPCHD